MKRVMVTGASGFVGRHVCRRLLEDGWQVCGTYRRDPTSMPAGVEPLQVAAVEAFDQWPKYLKNVDAVVHLVARAHVMQDRATDPLASYRTVNVAGTERLLAGCRRAGVERLIYMSSIKAVGEGSPAAYRESDPCRPEDAYGISKREAEQLVETAAGGGLRCTILRPPLVYGPGAAGNFARMVKAVRYGLPLPLRSVRNVRSLIFVENLADAVAACLVHPGAAGEAFHVADATPLSTRQLIELLATAMGKSPRLLPAPVGLLRFAGRLAGKEAEVQRLVGSLTVATDHIHRKLAWQPPLTTEEGIRRTVAEFCPDVRLRRAIDARRAA